jgi:hypothetical protein
MRTGSWRESNPQNHVRCWCLFLRNGPSGRNPISFVSPTAFLTSFRESDPETQRLRFGTWMGTFKMNQFTDSDFIRPNTCTFSYFQRWNRLVVWNISPPITMNSRPRSYWDSGLHCRTDPFSAPVLTCVREHHAWGNRATPNLWLFEQ